MFTHLELSPMQIRIWRFMTVIAVLLVLPIPWKYDMSNAFGMAFRLDGHLEVNGQVIDPPDEGEWYRLAAIGRPQMLGEMLYDEYFGSTISPALDIRAGPPRSKPVIGLPSAVGAGLMYADADNVPNVHASVRYGRFSGSWLSNFHTGGSHGLMIALITYADVRSLDLVQGRSIAGTGGIRPDGTVTSINNLEAKARAANRKGADVLLIPGAQEGELVSVSLPGTEVVSVDTLHEAVVALMQSVD